MLNMAVSAEDFKDVFGFEMNEPIGQNLESLRDKFVTCVFGGEGKSTEKGKALMKTIDKCTAQTKAKDFAKVFHEEYKAFDKQSSAETIKKENSKKANNENQSAKVEEKSVLHQLLLDLGQTFWNRDASQENDSNVERAAENNAKQVKRLSEKGTIWHAVSSFGTAEGKHSWKTVKIVNSLLAQDGVFEAPWMNGSDRGNFGETPLHIALLFNAPGPEYTAFFKELWTMCPRLHTEFYSEPLYRGENALHIAIIKKAGLDVIRTMVESPAGAPLLAGRADGAFFKAAAYSDGAANNLGEYPICFAACTNQPGVLEFLIRSQADLAVTTQEGNNLLHLMVPSALNL